MALAILKPRDLPLPFRSLNWLLLVLCLVIVVVVSFFLFYFNRLLGRIFALCIRLWFWRSGNVWVDCEGLQISMLAGRIFIKDLRYHSRNQSIRIQRCHITWRYWLWASRTSLETLEDDANSDSSSRSVPPCRIHAVVDGLELFFYNRTPAYDEIINQIQQACGQTSGMSSTHLEQLSGEQPDFGYPLDDMRVNKGTRVTVITHPNEERQAYPRAALAYLEPFSRAIQSVAEYLHPLVPSFDVTDILPVSFEGSTCAIVSGNDSTPSLLIAEALKLTGTYGVRPCRSEHDLYQNVYSLKMSPVKMVLRTNPDFQTSMVERGERIKADLSEVESINVDTWWSLLSFQTFRRLVKMRGTLINKSTPRPPPKWKGLARYMTDAQRREAGQLGYDEQYAKVTTVLDTPELEAVYCVDVPGFVPHNAQHLGLSGPDIVDIGNGGLPPEWKVDIKLCGASVWYGPWADRQRDLLQRTFFPPSYINRSPSEIVKPGSFRLHTSLVVSLELSQALLLRLPTRESSKDWDFEALAFSLDSRKPNDKRPFGWLDISMAASTSLIYTMGMVSDEKGYCNNLEVFCASPNISSSVNGASFWRSDACKVVCDLPSPLAWNANRSWMFDISFVSPTIYLLRDHVTLMTDLVVDWTSGPPSNPTTFIPTVYNFRLNLKNYTIHLYLNDHNIIDLPLVDDRNSLLISHGPSLEAQIEVPSDQIQPPFRTVSFWVDLPRLTVDMSLPNWNTLAAHCGRLIRLGSADLVRLDSSYTTYAELLPDSIERFIVDIKTQNLTFINHAWSIRHMLRLRDNYFGRFTHFSTSQEYMDNKSLGIVGDSRTVKSPKPQGNIFEVTLHANLENVRVLFPEQIYGSGAAVVAASREVQVTLRLHDYFLEMSFNTTPITLSSLRDLRSLSSLSNRPDCSEGRIVIPSLDVVANRLLGPPPATATYLCLWEIRLGRLYGVASLQLLTVLANAARAFVVNYSDAMNAPDAAMELLTDPDLTFLKVNLEGFDLTIRNLDSAIQVLLPSGVNLDYNDLPGRSHRKFFGLRVPRLLIRSLLRSPLTSDIWLEVASMVCDIVYENYGRPPDWEEDAALQLRFLLEQDAPTRRLLFLYDTTASTDIRVQAPLHLPSFSSALSRPPFRGTAARPQQQVPYPQGESDDDEENGLGQQVPTARGSENRSTLVYHEESAPLSSDDDNQSTTDDSAKDDQSSEGPHQGASDSSDSASESSDSPRWPRFEHYHHVLNRYRLSQASVSAHSSFVLARDPLDTVIWEPLNPDFHNHPPIGGNPSEISPGSLETESSPTFSIALVRSRRPMTIFLSPMLVPSVRSLFTTHKEMVVKPSVDLDDLLSVFLKESSQSSTKSPSGRSSYELVLPQVNLVVLQRLEPLISTGDFPWGNTTQLLASTNFRFSQLSLSVSLPMAAAQTTSTKPPKMKPNAQMSLQSASIHMHTVTSHPRSDGFVPATLAYLVIGALSASFTGRTRLSSNLRLARSSISLDPTSPRLLALTFETARRSIAKLATTIKVTNHVVSRRKQQLVFLMLNKHEAKSRWNDPLSWTDRPFFMKSGLPSLLRNDESWRILSFLRYCSRSYGIAHPKEDQTPASREQMADLMVQQTWSGLPSEPGALPSPSLLEILYPSSKTQSIQMPLSFEADLQFQTLRLRVSTGNAIEVSRLRVVGTAMQRFKSIAESQEPDSLPDLMWHAIVSVTLLECVVRIQPSLIPFIREVLTVQKHLSRRPSVSGPSRVPLDRLDYVMLEATLRCQSTRFEASAVKIIMDVASKDLTIVTTASHSTIDSRTAFGISLTVAGFRFGTKATPQGSRVAADQDTLAEVVFSRSALSCNGDQTAASRQLLVTLSQQKFLIHVPRSALKLYNFAREWRQEYLSQYHMMVQDLLAELETSSATSAPPASRYKLLRPIAISVDLSFKSMQARLQVMHGTWISWELGDSVMFAKGSYAKNLGINFGLDVVTQRIDIVSQAGPAVLSSPAIRLPLPRFTSSGSYNHNGGDCRVFLGRFDIKLKPKYVDDILTIQQKFGNDFAELVDLYVTKRKENLDVQTPSETTPGVPFNVSVALDGFRISLEGPSSTQYVHSSIIEADVIIPSIGATTWSAALTGLSLSLAHHSAPTISRVNLDRRYRSAYMEIEVFVDNKGTIGLARRLNVQVKNVHAVMQVAAFGELGDLVDYIKAEMLLRQEQRAVELEELRQKGRFLRTKLERVSSIQAPPKSTWFDDREVTVEILSIGVAFPLSAEEDVMPSQAFLQPGTSLLSSSVTAFLFSVAEIHFLSQRYEKGELQIQDFAFQFVEQFDQSIPKHFEAVSHESVNGIRLPYLQARLFEQSSGLQRRINATATVDGLELYLDASIVDNAFSLIQVYRQGKARLERLAPGQAKTNIEALSARIASAETVEHRLSAAAATTFRAELTVRSGRISLRAPEAFRSDPNARMLFREISGVDSVIEPMLEGHAVEFGVDVVVLPELKLTAAFTGASASDKFAQDQERKAVSSLKVGAHILGSRNTIYPSILPFMVEVVRNLESRLDNMSAEDALPDPPVSAPPADDSPTFLPAATNAIGGHLHMDFELRVDDSHLAISCLPDVDVVATLDWERSSLFATVHPGIRDINVMGTIGGIKAGLRHAYLGENSVTAEARNLTFQLKFGNVLNGSGPALVASLKTQVDGTLRCVRLQDLLCFKAVWLDRIPIFEGRPSVPDAPLTVSKPHPRSTFGTNVVAIILPLNLAVDLGHSITEVNLKLRSLEIRRIRTRHASNLSILLDDISLNASRWLSGHLEMPGFIFKTNRSSEDHGIARKRRRINKLEVHMDSQSLDLSLEVEGSKMLALHADPFEARVSDDWTAMSESDNNLQLDFAVSGGTVNAAGLQKTVPLLIDTAGKIKRLLDGQKQGAARDSHAFRSGQHAKPANPLSAVAATMLTSARSKFQQSEDYDFTIVQKMHFNVDRLQLELDLGSVYLYCINSVTAELERTLPVGSPSANKRILHLELGTFKVFILSDAPRNEPRLIQNEPSDSRRLMTFPKLEVHMTSTLQESEELAYEFDSTFPRGAAPGDGDKAFLDTSVNTVAKFVLSNDELRTRIATALAKLSVQDAIHEVGEPLSAVPHEEDKSRISKELPHSLDLKTSPKPTTQSPLAGAMTYREIRSSIEAPPFQQISEEISSFLAENVTAPSSFISDLPHWVHEYATLPVEGIMKVLLRVYAERLRKGTAVYEEPSDTEVEGLPSM